MRVAHHWFVLLSVSVACICTADSDVPHQGKVQQPGCTGDDCPLELETKVNRQRRQLPNCTDPMTPMSLQFNLPTATTESGRERWIYNVTWEEVQSAHCISYYKTRFPSADSPVVEVLTANREVYTDGNVEVTFYLATVDGELEKSPITSATITTDLLRPQVSPTFVSLTANSPNCVRLSWQPPEYPNGPLTGYMYNCGNGWTSKNTEVTNQQICTFSPYQNIECRVKAVNSAGQSNAATVYETTHCGAPELPSDISGYVTEEAYLPLGSIYHRRRATINVPVMDVGINCESIISAKAWLAGTDPSDGNVIEDLDALSTYTIQYQVANDANLASVPHDVRVTTGELEPSACPVAMQSANLSCIQLSWNKPNPPNGIITQYQYRCALTAYLSQTQFKTTSKETSITVCGYVRGNEVACAVKASTAIGDGPLTEDSATTQCSKPSEPIVMVSDYVYLDSSTERIRMDVQTVVHLSNCELIVLYSIVISTTSGVLIANKTSAVPVNTNFTDLNPYTEYIVRVTATNNEGLAELGEIVWKTSPAKPQDSPSVKLSFNTSCVFLNISAPKISNGNVTHYKYSCMQTKELAQPILVEASDVVKEKPAVCGFKATAYVTCNVTAINSAGDSPTITTSGRTLLQLADDLETYNFTEIVQNDDVRELRIILKPIEFVNMAPMIRLYRVLVGRDDDEQTSVFFDEEKCDPKYMLDFTIANSIGSSCYITAEVRSEYVTSEGLSFLLGDGTIIGGFFNAPLDSDASYSLMISVVLGTEDGQDLEYQLRPYKFLTPLYTITTTTQNDSIDGKQTKTIIISVTVAGSVLILVALVAIVHQVIFRRRKRNRSSAPSISTINNSSISEDDPYSTPNPNPGQIYSGQIPVSVDVPPIPLPRVISNYCNIPAPYDVEQAGDVDAANESVALQDERPELTYDNVCPDYKATVEEFTVVEEELNYDKPQLILGKMVANRTKNRYTDNLPDDRYVPSLPGGSYFNGTLIDSEGLKDHILATQLPLKHTKGDFWKVMEHQEITVIVQLDSKEDIEGYMFAGDHIEEEILEENELMTIKSVNVHDYTVTLMAIRDWPDGRSSLPDMKSMLRYTTALHKHQEDGGYGKICVMDMDGSTRCGLFIAAYNIMMMCKKPSDSHDKIRSQIINIRSRCRRCLSDKKHHEFIRQLYDKFTSQYVDFSDYAVRV